MSDLPYRGVHAQHEVAPERLFRDTRRTGQRWAQRLANNRVAAGWVLGMTVLAFAYPLLLWPLTIAALWVGFYSLAQYREDVLPLRLPQSAECTDYNDPTPQHRGFNQARGIFYRGTEKKTHAQLWQSKRDLLMHTLVFGTTGSGKTEVLLSMAANSLCMGSGVIFSDAKATPDLTWRIHAVARLLGRDDDMLAINYITGTSKYQEITPERRTNTNNPWATGTADALMQILSALMSQSGGDNKVFEDKGTALMTSILYALVDLRDKGEITMGIETIRNHLTLSRVIELRENTKISERVRRIVLAYLESSLAGYIDGAPADKQVDETHRQHGFATAYFSRALSSLTDTYGNIYLTTMGEVDYYDVVVNRRILVTSLPALEKSPQELSNLAKVNFAGLRDALRVGLGQYLEGSREEVLDSLPTASNVPMLTIGDEMAYQMVDGFAIAAAQARGLGFAMVYGAQDFAGMAKNNEREAQQIVSNTRTKLLMALEDPTDTWELFQKLAGEALVSQAEHFEKRKRPFFADYADSHGARFERRSRVDIRDMRDMVEGEAVVFFGSQILQSNTFFVDVEPQRHFRINRFLCVGDPEPGDDPAVLRAVRDLTAFFAARQATGDMGTQAFAGEDHLHRALDVLHASADEGAMESTITALVVYAGGIGADAPQPPTVFSAGGDDLLATAEALGSADEDPSSARARRVDGDPIAAGPPADDDVPGWPVPARAGASAYELAQPWKPEDPSHTHMQVDAETHDPDEETDAPADGFLGAALASSDLDFMFTPDHGFTVEYDIADSISQIERAMGNEDAETTGAQVKQQIERALRYPTPPKPQVTQLTEADVNEAIDALLREEEIAGGDAECGEDPFI